MGHNTLYFDHPEASALQKAFVQDYMDRYKEAPHWEADRAYFADRKLQGRSRGWAKGRQQVADT